MEWERTRYGKIVSTPTGSIVPGEDHKITESSSRAGLATTCQPDAFGLRDTAFSRPRLQQLSTVQSELVDNGSVVIRPFYYKEAWWFVAGRARLRSEDGEGDDRGGRRYTEAFFLWKHISELNLSQLASLDIIAKLVANPVTASDLNLSPIEIECNDFSVSKESLTEIRCLISAVFSGTPVCSTDTNEAPAEFLRRAMTCVACLPSGLRWRVSMAAVANTAPTSTLLNKASIAGGIQIESRRSDLCQGLDSETSLGIECYLGLLDQLIGNRGTTIIELAAKIDSKFPTFNTWNCDPKPSPEDTNLSRGIREILEVVRMENCKGDWIRFFEKMEPPPSSRKALMRQGPIPPECIPKIASLLKQPLGSEICEILEVATLLLKRMDVKNWQQVLSYSATDDNTRNLGAILGKFTYSNDQLAKWKDLCSWPAIAKFSENVRQALQLDVALQNIFNRWKVSVCDKVGKSVDIRLANDIIFLFNDTQPWVAALRERSETSVFLAVQITELCVLYPKYEDKIRSLVFGANENGERGMAALLYKAVEQAKENQRLLSEIDSAYALVSEKLISLAKDSSKETELIQFAKLWLETIVHRKENFLEIIKACHAAHGSNIARVRICKALLEANDAGRAFSLGIIALSSAEVSGRLGTEGYDLRKTVSEYMEPALAKVLFPKFCFQSTSQKGDFNEIYWQLLEEACVAEAERSGNDSSIRKALYVSIVNCKDIEDVATQRLTRIALKRAKDDRDSGGAVARWLDGYLRGAWAELPILQLDEAIGIARIGKWLPCLAFPFISNHRDQIIKDSESLFTILSSPPGDSVKKYVTELLSIDKGFYSSYFASCDDVKAFISERILAFGLDRLPFFRLLRQEPVEASKIDLSGNSSKLQDMEFEFWKSMDAEGMLKVREIGYDFDSISIELFSVKVKNARQLQRFEPSYDELDELLNHCQSLEQTTVLVQYIDAKLQVEAENHLTSFSTPGMELDLYVWASFFIPLYWVFLVFLVRPNILVFCVSCICWVAWIYIGSWLRRKRRQKQSLATLRERLVQILSKQYIDEHVAPAANKLVQELRSLNKP